MYYSYYFKHDGYASGVFFKKTELGWNDKIMILYYYTLVKQASLFA